MYGIKLLAHFQMSTVQPYVSNRLILSYISLYVSENTNFDIELMLAKSYLFCVCEVRGEGWFCVGGIDFSLKLS